MNNKRRKLLNFIKRFIQHTEKRGEIIKYLFENTELFEERIITDYNNDLYRYFAGKITNTSRELNKLYEVMDQKMKEEINEMRLLE